MNRHHYPPKLSTESAYSKQWGLRLAVGFDGNIEDPMSSEISPQKGQIQLFSIEGEEHA